MNIGEVRQALRVPGSETAAEQGRRKGYRNTKEGIYGHSGMCYNEESRNEENRQPDGEPDSILMTMEESK